MNPIEHRLAILQHKAAIKKLSQSTPNPTDKMLSTSKRINEKFQARKKKNQEIAESLAAEEIQRLASAKVAAATKPSPPTAPVATVAAKPTPTAPKPPAPELHGHARASAAFAAKAKGTAPAPAVRNPERELTGFQKVSSHFQSHSNS